MINMMRKKIPSERKILLEGIQLQRDKTGESVIEHVNDELNSSFTEALNHEKEKKSCL